MALFQSSVLKSHLALLDEDAVNKAYKKYQKYFWNTTIQENIKKANEEQYQATFLSELFVNILGYTLFPNPDSNLTTEFKNEKNNRKADAAILIDGVAIGVIELKGTNTKDLESIRRQAFDYKANHKGCVYVITSNFEKLRFYINDATEFEEFDLFTLTPERFKLLYFCLHIDNVINHTPLKVKEASVRVEEEITKKFYQDYSVFKRELFRDLVKKNSRTVKDRISETNLIENEEYIVRLEKNVKLTLFQKSQKLIDRFLFIFFAEDRMLLPYNSTLQILDKWKSDWDFGDERPLYDLFKQYFNFLDTGRKGTQSRAEIYAYNGGLFKPDAILDALEIDSDLLYKHTHLLSNYDFSSQVDVNILGHIFENSLNEIESINAEIEGGEFDKQTSKRKKDGVFYTPKYITQYIVENTIGKLCEEKKIELDFHEEEYFKGRKNRNKTTIIKLVDILDEYRAWLLQLTICDPACGSGAFLNEALDFLIKEHNYIDELKTKILGGGFQFPDIESTILENNIYGVDINEESVEIAKLSLWLRTAQPRRKLNDLNDNIKCGNSLIEDKKVAGDKAFNWEEEFSSVFAKGGFDVVIGNPPYGASFNDSQKEYIVKNYGSYQYKFESYLYFYEKGIDIINEEGLLSFITPELFLRLDKSENIRLYLKNNSTPIELKFCGENVFQDVQVNSVIATFTKKIQTEGSITIIPENNLSWEYSLKRWRNGNGLIFDYEINPRVYLLISKIQEISKNLGQYGSAIQGLTPYDSYRGQSKEIIQSRAYHHDSKIDETCGIWLGGKDISRYSYFEGSEWLQYGEWLASPRDPKFFEGPRLLFREVPGAGKRIQCVYVEDKYYYGHSITPFKLSEDFDPLLIYRILAIANSKLLSWYASIKVSNFAKKTFPKLNPKDIRSLPISKLIEKDDSFMLQTKSILISELFKSLNDLSNRFHRYFSSKKSLIKTSRKLENWQDLSFVEFIKELNKTIRRENRERKKTAGDNTFTEIPTLTKKDEFEWMELFEENKKKAQELQTQITQTEKEIDQMVYELYGLSEEEINIVESA